MQENCTFTSDGLKLSGVLHVPEQRRAGERLPAFIVLHGFVGTKDEFACRAPGADARGIRLLRASFRHARLRRERGRARAVRCFDQVADTKNALTFSRQREEVDPERIGVIGHSFGAAVAVYTAGIDERVACVISSCGWGDGERKFRGQHPAPEAWAKFTDMLERGRRQRQKTGESMWVSRFDVVPIPEQPAQESLAEGADGGAGRDRHSMYNFRAEDVVAQHRAASADAVPHRQ